MNTNQATTALIDTFPDFKKYWSQYKHSSISAQMEGWLSEYMGKWPRLRRKQIEQYKSEGVEWRLVARQRIFPDLAKRIPKMRLARENILDECQPIIQAAEKQFKTQFEICVIIYVGIGLGAGWATKYEKKPALLFGLENIAEEEWTDKAAIRGLIAHELGHLFHSYWRERAGKKFQSGPLWDLYTEGFADRFENSMQTVKSTHISGGSDDQESSTWFQKNRKWLANEFLKRFEMGGDMRPFFGSWYQIRGHSQMGYYLGSALIEKMEDTFPLKKIASLDHVSQRTKQLLDKMAKGKL